LHFVEREKADRQPSREDVAVDLSGPPVLLTSRGGINSCP
jgi:hypothetical protein